MNKKIYLILRCGLLFGTWRFIVIEFVLFECLWCESIFDGFLSQVILVGWEPDLRPFPYIIIHFPFGRFEFPFLFLASYCLNWGKEFFYISDNLFRIVLDCLNGLWILFIFRAWIFSFRDTSDNNKNKHKNFDINTSIIFCLLFPVFDIFFLVLMGIIMVS